MSRFRDFTDGEIYMLIRHAVESSFMICVMGDYSEEQKEIHENLMNELLSETARRG